MITLLTGKKGSGKTKKLIEMANAALEKTNGNVVVVEKGLKLTYDISHAARLIDIDAYDVKGGKGCMASWPAFALATTMSPTFWWIPP